MCKLPMAFVSVHSILLLFFFFLCAQFTCSHGNSECTLLTWTGCHSLSHTVGVLQSKAQCGECVHSAVWSVQPLMMTNVLQEA